MVSMKLRPKVLLATLAVAAFSAALTAPIAVAGTGTMMGGSTPAGAQTDPGAMMAGATPGTTDPGTGAMMDGGTGTTPDPGTPTGTMMGGTSPGTVDPGTMMGPGTTTDPQPGPSTMMGGTWDGSGPWGGTGMWGMMDSGMAWLADNPAAMQAWLQLRSEHLAAMQTWYETYKAGLTSAAAQQALHDLWTAQWNDMQGFMGQYASGADWTVPAMGMWSGWQMGDMMNGGTWNVSQMWGSGYGASWMMGDSAGMGQWLSLRGRQMSAAKAWMQHYGSAPGSPAAQAAMKTMTARERSQARRFFRQHHLPTSASMMRAATGGWMGLGGMWGGFGW
jgi:hypothetical protein